MKNFFISLIIGMIATIIDLIPMVVNKLDKYYLLSATSTWLVLGLLIPRIKLFQLPWLNGASVSILFIIPLLFLIAKLDKQAIPQIFITTVILGAGIGLTSSYFIK